MGLGAALDRVWGSATHHLWDTRQDPGSTLPKEADFLGICKPCYCSFSKVQLDRKGVLKEGSAEEDPEEGRGLDGEEGNGIESRAGQQRKEGISSQMLGKDHSWHNPP